MRRSDVEQFVEVGVTGRGVAGRGARWRRGGRGEEPAGRVLSVVGGCRVGAAGGGGARGVGRGGGGGSRERGVGGAGRREGGPRGGERVVTGADRATLLRS